MTKHWKRLAIGLPIVAAAFAAVSAIVFTAVKLGFELGLLAVVIVGLTFALAYCVGGLVELLRDGA